MTGRMAGGTACGCAGGTIDARDVLMRGRPSGDYGAHERVPGYIEYTDWYEYDGVDVLVSVEFTRGDWDSKELEDLPWDTAPAVVMDVITGDEEVSEWARGI